MKRLILCLTYEHSNEVQTIDLKKVREQGSRQFLLSPVNHLSKKN